VVEPEVDDPEFVCSLFESQQGRCQVSGLPLQGDYTHEDHPHGPIWRPLRRTASLDRVDSHKGYVKGNVVLVHILVNMAKRDMSFDEFVQMCRAVADTHPGKVPSTVADDDAA